LLVNVPIFHYVVRNILMDRPTTTTVPFRDDFGRTEVGDNYWTTGGHWRIENGELHSPGVKNNPLWLQAALPDNVAVEFDVRGVSPEGDLKWEMFGDGLNHSSGYVFVMGGWNNQLTVLSRLNEHGPSFNAEGIGMTAATGAKGQDLVAGRGLAELYTAGLFKANAEWREERRDRRVEIGKPYHMRIEARGNQLTWFINGDVAFSINDPFRLKGKHHDRFAFSSWDSDLFFDNLSIQPL
jgi:hypothetical protein